MYRVRRAASPLLQHSSPELSRPGGGKGRTSNYLLPGSCPCSWVACPCLMSLQLCPSNPGGCGMAGVGTDRGRCPRPRMGAAPPWRISAWPWTCHPVVDGSKGGGGDTSMGISPNPPWVASFPAGLGDVEVRSSSLPMCWHLPAGWEFSCVPGEQTRGSSALLTYRVQARSFWSCEVLKFTFEFHIAIELPSRTFHPLPKSVSVTLSCEIMVTCAQGFLSVMAHVQEWKA